MHKPLNESCSMSLATSKPYFQCQELEGRDSIKMDDLEPQETRNNTLQDNYVTLYKLTNTKQTFCPFSHISPVMAVMMQAAPKGDPGEAGGVTL